MKIKYKFNKMIIIIICICFFNTQIVHGDTTNDTEDNTIKTTVNIPCVTTGYYSPLPNQRAYFQYDFENEKKLNGNGTNGADGTPVYLGMVAADKSIPFGSYIHIDGVGLFKVHDRGGAIKNKDGSFRIDIWMGKGEQGMAKALTWGVRRNTCTIYLPNEQVPKNIINKGIVWENINQKQIDNIVAKLNERKKDNIILASVAKINPEIENLKNSLNISQSLRYKDKSEQIRALNKYLKTIGYDVDDTDVYNDKTYLAVIDFQIKNNIIKNKNDFGAGYFGVKTASIFISAVTDILNKQNPIENIAQIDSIENVTKVKTKEEKNYIILASSSDIDKIDIEKEPNVIKNNTNTKLNFNLTLGMQNDDVIKLQNIMIQLGYLKRETTTNYFDLELSDAVFEYQKSKGIVYNKSDYGAGWVGPKTRKYLNNEFIENKNETTQIVLK